MPFKQHAERRHHIPKRRYRVTTWAEYDAALRQRGSLTVWFTEDAIAAWQAESRTTPGGQPRYSDMAITTALTLRAMFDLALRQTEGLIGSIIGLLGLDLAVPDHSTLSRRTRTLPVPLRRKLGSGPLLLLVDSTGLKRKHPPNAAVKQLLCVSERPSSSTATGRPGGSGAGLFCDNQIDRKRQPFWPVAPSGGWA